MEQTFITRVRVRYDSCKSKGREISSFLPTKSWIFVIILFPNRRRRRFFEGARIFLPISHTQTCRGLLLMNKLAADCARACSQKLQARTRVHRSANNSTAHVGNNFASSLSLSPLCCHSLPAAESDVRQGSRLCVKSRNLPNNPPSSASPPLFPFLYMSWL